MSLVPCGTCTYSLASPTYENFRVVASTGILKLKKPSASVTVPTRFSPTDTGTPTSGSPVSSVTWPLTVRSRPLSCCRVMVTMLPLMVYEQPIRLVSCPTTSLALFPVARMVTFGQRAASSVE